MPYSGETVMSVGQVERGSAGIARRRGSAATCPATDTDTVCEALAERLTTMVKEGDGQEFLTWVGSRNWSMDFIDLTCVSKNVTSLELFIISPPLISIF